MFEVLFFALIALVVGFAFCFMGYQFFRILLPIWAFFTGLMLGTTAITGWLGQGFLTTSTGIIIGVFLGLFFAAIAYFVYQFAVILFGATLGYTLGAGFMLLLGLDAGFFTFLAGTFMAVVFAVAFMSTHVPRYLIMVATAFGGAMAMITGVMVLFGKLPPEMISLSLARLTVGNSFLWMVVWLVVAGLGIATQYAMKKGSDDLLAEYEFEAVPVTPATPEATTNTTETTPSA